MNSIWYITEIDLTIRILIAGALGGLVGLEREWSNHPAGLRTHMLVCIGSAAIMLLSIYGFSDFVAEENVRVDPARLAAQVISGIGFLGAGAILRTGSTVSGLTTAASVWVVAAIGLCVGAGFIYAACLTTLVVLISLFVLNKFEKYLMRHRRSQEIVVKIYDRPGVLGNISAVFHEQDLQIENVKMKREERFGKEDDPDRIVELCISLRSAPKHKLIAAIDSIRQMREVVFLESNQWILPKKGAIPQSTKSM
ncbi:magnesium transporter MgtC [Paenibacillus sp. 32O-W]|uniref:MgtC/SapB/SrpB/YhiD N-terminal domain-containing protein n=1 Tax=Paenibacillus cisolokensis TaxID=1658519 RepID=A0ABQ4N0G5_9BACL|nr:MULTISPECIES: MgtC/SapB family protein [Paenibacillus]ALS29927.1 magnesium transporter MgtC [Paenibacillus sp. 32O-W]GIQ61667.1 hypothetical protein PACILC2_02350 [Paenibacillus cisolokensis]